MLHRLQGSVRHDDAGFTLIELLIVIVIIGILSAIAIPVYLHQRQKAVEASMRSDLRNVADWMESYYVENQTYPTKLSTAGQTVTLGQAPDPVVTVQVTKGDTISLDGNAATVKPGTYCLKASDPRADSDLWYDSDAGGLLPRGSQCA